MKKKKKKIDICNLNEIDAQGDLILPGSFKDKFNVPLLSDHNTSLVGMIGHADVWQEGNKIVAESEDLPDNWKDYYYPAIGFQLIESHMQGDVRVIDKMRIFEVSLCKRSAAVDDNPKKQFKV